MKSVLRLAKIIHLGALFMLACPSLAQSNSLPSVLKISQICGATQSDESCLHAAVNQLLNQSRAKVLDLEGRTFQLLTPIPIYGSGGFDGIVHGTIDCGSFQVAGGAAFKLLSTEQPFCPVTNSVTGAPEQFCNTNKHFERLVIQGRHKCDGFSLNGRYYDIFIRNITVNNPAAFAINDSYVNPPVALASTDHSGHVLHISHSTFVSDGSPNVTAIHVGSADSLISGNSITGFANGIEVAVGRPAQLIGNTITMRELPRGANPEPALTVNSGGTYALNVINGGVVFLPQNPQGGLNTGIFAENQITVGLPGLASGFLQVQPDPQASAGGNWTLDVASISNNRFCAPVGSAGDCATPTPGQQILSDSSTASQKQFGGAFLSNNNINSLPAASYPAWQELWPKLRTVTGSGAQATTEVTYYDGNPNHALPLGCAATHAKNLKWIGGSSPSPDWNLVQVDANGQITIRFKGALDWSQLGSFTGHLDCAEPVVGEVGGIDQAHAGLWGFACVSGVANKSIAYEVYVGGPMGSGHKIGGGVTDQVGTSNWTNNPCADPVGSKPMHGFWLDLASNAYSQLSGQAIYIYAISPLSGQRVLLPGSGGFKVP